MKYVLYKATPPSGKSVSIDGVKYSGVRKAARALHISRQCLVYRLKSKHYPTYFYVTL